MASQRNPYGLKKDREGRRKKRRRREIRKAVLASSFVLLQVAGFWMANFSQKDSWTELIGFVLLQPMQMGLNLLDGRFQLTRGISDRDAVLLVTLLALSLNILLWYAVWRGWRRFRRRARQRWHAARSVRGSWKAKYGASAAPGTRRAQGLAGAAAQTARPEIAVQTELPLGK